MGCGPLMPVTPIRRALSSNTAPISRPLKRRERHPGQRPGVHFRRFSRDGGPAHPGRWRAVVSVAAVFIDKTGLMRRAFRDDAAAIDFIQNPLKGVVIKGRDLVGEGVRQLRRYRA